MVGRPPKYPWREWFDDLARGSIIGIVHGVDFDHDPKHMRSQIMLQARNRGVAVKTSWLPRAGRFDVVQILRQKYSWDQWLDGELHVIQASDFQGKTFGQIAQLIRQAGARRGLKVHTQQRNGTLAVQAFERGTS